MRPPCCGFVLEPECHPAADSSKNSTSRCCQSPCCQCPHRQGQRDRMPKEIVEGVVGVVPSRRERHRQMGRNLQRLVVVRVWGWWRWRWGCCQSCLLVWSWAKGPSRRGPRRRCHQGNRGRGRCSARPVLRLGVLGRRVRWGCERRCRRTRE